MEMTRIRTGDSYKSFKRDSSIERFKSNASINKFVTWVANRPKSRSWDLIHGIILGENANPVGGGSFDLSSGSRGIKRSRWIRSMREIGFTDEVAAGVIFDEVALENGAGTRKPEESEDEPMIWMAQFKRFQLRLVAVSSMLNAGDENSPAMRFIRFIKQKHSGSVVRGWHLDIDIRGTGKVACVDFTTACRNLGMSGQAKLIWDNLRPDRQTPLEVHDLDPSEAENFEDFSDALWNSTGFDLDKAWLFLDPNSQNHVSYEDFRVGVKQLGFEGDSKLLFKGLDTSGLGRLNRPSFEYLAKISRLAHRRLGGMHQSPSAVADLITWVQRELGGAHELLVKLGLGGTGAHRRILVSDLAARLTALGFQGDALGAATKAARTEGGNQVSADSLYALLSGIRPAGGNAGDRARSLTPRAYARKQAMPTEEGWNSSVADFTASNKQKCKYQKSYFEPTARALTPPPSSGRPTTPLLRATTPRNLGDSTPRKLQQQQQQRAVSAKRMLERRPAWNAHTDVGVPLANKCLAPRTRTYFSDPSSKPVRERQRALVETRQAMKANQAWDTVEELDLATY